MKATHLDKTIAALEAERHVIDMAILKLREQQKKAPTRKAPTTRLAAAVPAGGAK